MKNVIKNSFAVESYLKSNGFEVSPVRELGREAMAEVEKHTKEISKNGVTVQYFEVDGKILAAAQIHEATGQSKMVPDQHLPALAKMVA